MKTVLIQLSGTIACLICVTMETYMGGSKLQEQLRKVEYSPSEEKRLKLEVECLEKGKKSLK